MCNSCALCVCALRVLYVRVLCGACALYACDLCRVRARCVLAMNCAGELHMCACVFCGLGVLIVGLCAREAFVGFMCPLCARARTR